MFPLAESKKRSKAKSRTIAQEALTCFSSWPSQVTKNLSHNQSSGTGEEHGESLECASKACGPQPNLIVESELQAAPCHKLVQLLVALAAEWFQPFEDHVSDRLALRQL